MTTSHCSNNFGPFQYPDKLIPLVVLSALKGEAIPIYGDGLNRRDWLHVADHCRGIEACLARGVPGERYNIGGGTELTNLEIVETICTQLDRLFEEHPELARRFPSAPACAGRPASELITFVADRPGHDRRYAIDTSKARRELGYEPQEKFAEAVLGTILWYLDNEEWWRRSA